MWEHASTGYTSSRASGNKVTTGRITIAYPNLRDGRIVPIAVSYDRTFAQKVVTTSFDAPTTGAGSARFELRSAGDAISFGNPTLWPGEPAYSDVWSCTGTTPSFLSEAMDNQGFQALDQTIAFSRSDSSTRTFGFEPTVSAEVRDFSWLLDSGLVASTA